VEIVDGHSSEWLYDLDKLSYFDILLLVKDMGYSNIEKFHYLTLRKNLDNSLRFVEDDTSVQEMMGLSANFGITCEIFIEHGEDMSVGIGDGLVEGLMNT